MKSHTFERPDPVGTMIVQSQRAEIAVVCGRVANAARWAEAVLLNEALRRVNSQEVRG